MLNHGIVGMFSHICGFDMTRVYQIRLKEIINSGFATTATISELWNLYKELIIEHY